MTSVEVPAPAVHRGSEVPVNPKPREKFALCLSGGGYRASLFHLGALRRLNECGLLGWLDTIVSVSGGSITAAHAARRISPWPKPGEVFPDWEHAVAAPLRAFCRVDIRTPAAWRGIMNPLRMWKDGGVPSGLVEEAIRRFVHGGGLRDLPERPRFVFQASDVDGGTLFRFERDRVVKGGRAFATRPEDRIARAVAASAGFPPVFAPIPASDDPKRFTKKGAPAEGLVPLSDGGLYDNLGLQPVIQQHKHIFISDAGAPWDYSAKPRGLMGFVGRYPAVLMKQIQNLRMREWINLRENEWLHQNRRIEGAWWSLSAPKLPTTRETTPDPKRPVSYPDDFLESFVMRCRTDLNTFTATEAGVLENAGYMHCAIALHDRFQPLPGMPAAPPAQWPHPDLADAGAAATCLNDIGNRMPGGFLKFAWHMLWNHDLPDTLPRA